MISTHCTCSQTRAYSTLDAATIICMLWTSKVAAKLCAPSKAIRTTFILSLVRPVTNYTRPRRMDSFDFGIRVRHAVPINCSHTKTAAWNDPNSASGKVPFMQQIIGYCAAVDRNRVFIICDRWSVRKCSISIAAFMWWASWMKRCTLAATTTICSSSIWGAIWRHRFLFRPHQSIRWSHKRYQRNLSR